MQGRLPVTQALLDLHCDLLVFKSAVIVAFVSTNLCSVVLIRLATVLNGLFPFYKNIYGCRIHSEVVFVNAHLYMESNSKVTVILTVKVYSQ